MSAAELRRKLREVARRLHEMADGVDEEEGLAEPAPLRFLDVAAVAERLNVSARWVRTHHARIGLTAVRFGQQIRFAESEVTAYLAMLRKKEAP